MNEPEQTIMRTSLSRPQQLLGGDREMVIMAGLGAAMMAVSVMSFCLVSAGDYCASGRSSLFWRGSARPIR